MSCPPLSSRPFQPAAPTLQWLNGSRASGDAELESDRFRDGVRRIRGRSYSQAVMHIDLPLPAGTVLQAVWLRARMQQGVLLQSIRLFDCEQQVAELGQLQLQIQDWQDQRFLLPQACTVQRSLSLCLECQFGATGRELSLAAIGCETIQAAVQRQSILKER